MCSSVRHVLLIGLVILDISFVYSVVEDGQIRDVPLMGANDTIGYRSSLRIPDHRNRTGTSDKNRGRPNALGIRGTPSPKKRQRHRIGQMADQQVLPVNGSQLDTPTESELQLRRSLRQKRRKLKRLWQEIDRIQRALKVADGRQRNGKETEEKVKTKNRKSHWRRRMMQRLKLLSRQLQEQQQQRAPSMDTVEKLFALLAVEPTDDTGRGRTPGNNVADRNGRRTSGRKPKKHREQFQKGNSTMVIRGLDAALPGIPGRSAVKHGVNHGNRSVHHSLARHRLSNGGSRTNSKTGSIASLGRSGVKKGEAGSVCASHKNCKPGFCCHQTHSMKTSLNATNNVCVEHRLKQGQPCANSCQCDNGLQCFISRKDKLYHKRLPPPDSSSPWSSQDEGSSTIMMTAGQHSSSNDGQCKIPAMDDVLHGTYIIGEHALFKSNP